MIVTQFYTTRADGVNLYRTYSDSGFYIERDGVRYEEAIDPDGTNRTYIETTEPIHTSELHSEDSPLILTAGEV